MSARDEYYGHKTMIDGSHVPLAKDEAEAIMAAIEVARRERAQTMPSARDALGSMIQACQRMQELGWWKGGGLRIQPGDECAVAQTGSVGIFHGRLDSDRKYVHFGDSVAQPHDCWLKSLADLTDNERAWMSECDQREAQAYTATLNRLDRSAG